MFSSFIENAIRATEASQLTEGFMWVLMVIFVLSLWWKRNDQHGGFTNYTPTLLTSIGILGTFTGIISGLLEFDTRDIDGSIGPLLEGLKTAFITSLSGMLLSIVYKAIVTSGVLNRADRNIISDDELGVADLYNVMKQQAEGIEQLKKAINENDESSLVGQVKLLRSDMGDHNKAVSQHLLLMAQAVTKIHEISEQQATNFKAFEDRLWIKLQDFADMLSKSATEQVIEALKQVIQDFNDNLIEQFGENFKQLNEAVYRLVEWQDNYKDQLSDMKDKYELGVQAITKTETSIANISEEAKNIPVTMNVLKDVMEINRHQLSELENHLEAFKDIRDRAVLAVPEIRDQIDLAIEGATEANKVLAKGMLDSATHMEKTLIEGSEQFTESVRQTNISLIESSQTTANSSEKIKEQFETALEDINSHMRNLISELQQGGASLNESFQDASKVLITESKESSRIFTQGIEEMSRTLEQTIKDQANEHRQQADKIFNGLEKSIENALSNTGESVQKQVEMIDKVLGEEVEKVLTSMGSALATISGKFTEDYSKLVRQMNEVVNTKPH